MIVDTTGKIQPTQIMVGEVLLHSMVQHQLLKFWKRVQSVLIIPLWDRV